MLLMQVSKIISDKKYQRAFSFDSFHSVLCSTLLASALIFPITFTVLLGRMIQCCCPRFLQVTIRLFSNFLFWRFYSKIYFSLSPCFLLSSYFNMPQFCCSSIFLDSNCHCGLFFTVDAVGHHCGFRMCPEANVSVLNSPHTRLAPTDLWNSCTSFFSPGTNMRPLEIKS